MSAVPAPVASTLRALTTALDAILGANLVGVYLYGSLTQGAFDPARSDVDCLVVVRRDLTDSRFQKLRAWLAQAATSDPWMHRVQMQVLVRGRLLRPDTRGALYQFGTLKRSGSDGNPIIWLNVLASGVALLGPAPESFLPPITRVMIFDALVREVGYLRAEIADPASEWRDRRFYRTYAVLTLCRIVYSHQHGGVVSKPRAARWALRTLPSRWRSLVRAAMASARGRPAALPLARIARFIEFVEGQLVPTSTARGSDRVAAPASRSLPKRRPT
jgi:predicted nucleotidyltransferase